MLFKTKGFIEPKGSKRDFEVTGQKACVCALMRATEGLKVGCIGMGGLQKLITFFSGWAGLQKLITVLDTRNGHKGGV